MTDLDELLDNAQNGNDEQAASDRFRRGGALLIAILALLLAVATLGGDNAAEAAMYNNIVASDLFAWYQAKNIRQTFYELTADDLTYMIDETNSGLSPDQLAALQDRLERYTAIIERYDSEPDPAEPDNPLKGEGKQQLLAQALAHRDARDRALSQDPNFDYATALYQIAIVLASVAILASSRALLTLSAMMGAVATGLMLNGFFLWFPLPF